MFLNHILVNYTFLKGNYATQKNESDNFPEKTVLTVFFTVFHFCSLILDPESVSGAESYNNVLTFECVVI